MWLPLLSLRAQHSHQGTREMCKREPWQRALIAGACWGLCWPFWPVLGRKGDVGAMSAVVPSLDLCTSFYWKSVIAVTLTLRHLRRTPLGWAAWSLVLLWAIGFTRLAWGRQREQYHLTAQSTDQYVHGDVLLIPLPFWSMNHSWTNEEMYFPLFKTEIITLT